MSGSKSNYLEQAFLDFVLGNTSYSPPATVYIALSTDNFSTASTGASMSEVTGGAYARVSITNNTTNFPSASGGNPATKTNANTINFSTATASWGTIQSVYVLDASSGGNVLFGADLASAIAINSGSSFSIPAGQFLFNET